MLVARKNEALEDFVIVDSLLQTVKNKEEGKKKGTVSAENIEHTQEFFFDFVGLFLSLSGYF